MQRRKIVIATLTLLIVGLALPSTNLPKAHAFLNGGSSSVTVSNVLANFIPPPATSGGGITVAQGGTTITVTVVVQGSSFQTPAYQRNVTIGFNGDWMVNYQNSSVITLTTDQIASTTLSIVLPSVSSYSPNHSWTVRAWDGPASGAVANCLGAGNTDNGKGCFDLSGGSLTLLTADQYSAAQARTAALTALSSVIISGPFGGSVSLISNDAAIGQLAQANSERSLGDQSWASGDFSGAKTHYQNSQNDVNAALATQYNLGGGQTNAGIASTLLSGSGIALFGLGGFLAGIGGFFYLRRRPKA